MRTPPVITPSLQSELRLGQLLPSTTKLCNELPEPLVMIDNLTSFKDQLAQHVLSELALNCICVFILPARFNNNNNYYYYNYCI